MITLRNNKLPYFSFASVDHCSIFVQGRPISLGAKSSIGSTSCEKTGQTRSQSHSATFKQEGISNTGLVTELLMVIFHHYMQKYFQSYQRVGAVIKEDISEASVVFGVKQV